MDHIENNGNLWDEAPLTLADLCAAIAAGRVPYTVRDGRCELRAADVRRVRREDVLEDAVVRITVVGMDASPRHRRPRRRRRPSRERPMRCAE